MSIQMSSVIVFFQRDDGTVTCCTLEQQDKVKLSLCQVEQVLRHLEVSLDTIGLPTVERHPAAVMVLE